MENQGAAARLKDIRIKSGLSIGKVADRMGLEIGAYRHYEERYKGNNMPVDFVQRLLTAFEDQPHLEADIRALIELPGTHLSGLHESGAHLRGKKLASALYSGQEPEPDIVIQSDGKRLIVQAKVDRQGLEKLIKRLQISANLLD
jgi:transcriptional regulator with XRE-family HTH domain